MRFKNKVVLITGASRGIGKATALQLGREGAKVIVNYKSNKKEADEIVSLIGNSHAVAIQADVSIESEILKMVSKVSDNYGSIDVLINNAGEIIRPGDWKTNKEIWDSTLNVNLTSVWMMIKNVVPIMKKNEMTSIVNITSTVGLLGVAPVLAYSAAKNGIVSITKGMAKELAPHIRVNAVAPSNVMTDMTKGAGKELIEYMKSQTPLRRIAEPEELAKAIAFLASDDASYITGEVLVVDGGYSLK